MDKEQHEDFGEVPKGNKHGTAIRGALQAMGGAIPFAGGFLSAIAGAWSEKEQKRVNDFFRHWIAMLQDEMEEKEKTVVEMMSRLDLQDDEIAKRVESKEFQSLVKKSFRDWSAVESEEKRVYVRNILSNAAATTLTSDDVIRMFLEWIGKYSELHFQVIAAIYNANGITRGAIWKKLGKKPVREDSSDADLYKLLFRDLSTGGVVRQHREKDHLGNFYTKTSGARRKGSGPTVIKSAFDDEEGYELTELGRQFVHYAMTEIPPKIEYKPEG